MPGFITNGVNPAIVSSADPFSMTRMQREYHIVFKDGKKSRWRFLNTLVIVMVLIIDVYARDVRLDIVKINLRIGNISPSESTSTSTSTTSKKECLY